MADINKKDYDDLENHQSENGSDEPINDDCEDYIDNLINEADELFKDTQSEDILDDIASSNNSEEMSNKNKPRHKIRLNKGLLALGGCMIICTLVINNHMSNKHYATLPDYVSSGEASDNELSASTEIAVDTGDIRSIIGENIIIDDIDENEMVDEDGKEHLSNIPVEVTEEVDSYFKDCIKYLKMALSIDTFLVYNNTFQNLDMINSLQLMVTDYEDNIEKWKEHNIPKGCEQFDELIAKSLNAYQYYFKEVIDASNLETKEEYRNKLNASVAYVQTLVGNYSSVSQEFEPVFYYYGLYT